MYEVGEALPVDDLDPGSVLVSGPAMSGKYELLLDFIANGNATGDGSLFVTTNENSDSIMEDFEERHGNLPQTLRFVDCVSEQQSFESPLPEERVEYVNSPGDLTGLGIGASEQMRRFAESDTARVRIAFHSLSTLLMYSDIEPVFRFLHVLTGRIDGLDGLGFFTIDPTTHEEGTVNTLKQIFDAAIELRDGDDGTEVRFLGVSDAPDGWVAL